MAKQKIALPDLDRRRFMQWTLGLGTFLGVEPWKVFEVGESVLGSAYAQTVCAPVNRFVGNVMGNGGFAWMTQLFPFTDQATRGGASAFHATGRATDQLVESGDHPMKLGPHAPDLLGRRVTGFVAGTNEAHTPRPTSASTVDTGVSLFAAIASLQSASPTLVPAIAVGDMPFGAAPGAPALAGVATGEDMVGLFNSAASSAGAALAKADDAHTFEAFYKANLGLRRAAQRPTIARGHRTGKIASNLLGKNFADQLAPSDADLARYGVERTTPGKLVAIARTLVTTAKAFKLNLTSSVLLPGTNDDPHGAFADMADLERTVQTLGKIWGAFVADLAAEPDPTCAGAKIADNLVIAWTGDTGKDPNTAAAWPDGTPQSSNWMYVMGNGWLRSGWFGEVRGDDTIETWDPASGTNRPGGSSAAMGPPASAAVLYAIAKGDMRRVRELYDGPDIAGVVREKR